MFTLLKNIRKIDKIEYIIVGLGNPGNRYKNTRHNAGFLTIDYITYELNITNDQLKFNTQIFDAKISNRRVLLVKPQTYMNLSGDAVSDIMHFYKIPIEKIIVIVDDISLSPGNMRIRRKGSSAGHNGLKDIINKTGSDEFIRIKLGVGSKPTNWDLANWVTSEFSDSDRDKLDDSIKKAYNSIQLILEDKIDEAMNKFNS